jgi:hypothetical protein
VVGEEVGDSVIVVGLKVGLRVGNLNRWTVGEDVGAAAGDEVGDSVLVVVGLCVGL